jgi:hypothetical protein
MFSALIRAAERLRGLRFTEFELRQIAALSEELDAEYEAILTPSGRSSHPALFEQICALTRRFEAYTRYRRDVITLMVCGDDGTR